MAAGGTRIKALEPMATPQFIPGLQWLRRGEELHMAPGDPTDPQQVAAARSCNHWLMLQAWLHQAVCMPQYAPPGLADRLQAEYAQIVQLRLSDPRVYAYAEKMRAISAEYGAPLPTRPPLAPWPTADELDARQADDDRLRQLLGLT